MKTEKQLFITYFFPGSFFSEQKSERVTSTDIPKTIPLDCYGFHFSETEYVIGFDGKEFVGETKRISNMFIIGEEHHVSTIPDVDERGDTSILKSNIKNNSKTGIGIKTHLGSWQVKGDDTTVISEKDVKFSKPMIYEKFRK